MEDINNDLKSERVSVTQAAKELGVTPQAVREHMKRGLWQIGYCYSPKNTGKNNWEYHIYRHLLNRHLGKEAEKCT